jgi:hypothetical protein
MSGLTSAAVNTAKNHLLRDYNQLPYAALGDFALHVAAMLDGNTSLPNPPVKPADLVTAANTFIAAVAKCEDGTKQDTINKNALRAGLIENLDDDAKYVELTAKNDPQILASSGDNLPSGATVKPAPVGTVTISSVTNLGGGSLQLVLDMGPNVWGVEVQTSTATGVWVPAGYFTDPRKVTPANLTPGTTYAIRACVHGSLNQVSPWSDPVSHMVT